MRCIQLPQKKGDMVPELVIDDGKCEWRNVMFGKRIWVSAADGIIVEGNPDDAAVEKGGARVALP